MATHNDELLKQIQKENRILKRKLERSEAEREQLEIDNEKKEHILKQVIGELRDSQEHLQNKSQQLELALRDLQTMQSQLIESEKMSALGILVAGLSHEINNPVNFIYGNLEYAHQYTNNLLHLIQTYQRYYPCPPQEIQREIEDIDLDFLQTDLIKLLDSMKVGTDRIYKIVLSLRNFSRLDESALKTVDIHEGIESTLAILDHRLKTDVIYINHKLYPRPPIQVIKDYGDLPPVECYPRGLNQVFMNLLVNAIDAIESAHHNHSFDKLQTHPGKISITTQLLTSHQVQITIADNGIGIPEMIQPRIFDPFFTTKPVGQGTGLGLSISYKTIVETHKGSFWCCSTEGEGTTFFLQLPLTL